MTDDRTVFVPSSVLLVCPTYDPAHVDRVTALIESARAHGITAFAWANSLSSHRGLQERGTPTLSAGTSLGFGAAVNAAAVDKEFTWLLVLNDDVELGASMWPAILSTLRAQGDRGTGIVGLLPADGSTVEPLPGTYGTVGRVSTLTAVRRRLGRRGSVPTGTVPPGYGFAFVFVAISRRAWTRLSGFDESFPFYFEDADLLMRAHHAGIAVAAASLNYSHAHSATAAVQLRYVLPLLARGGVQFLQRHRGWSPRSARTLVAVALGARGAVALLRPGRLASEMRAISGAIRALYEDGPAALPPWRPARELWVSGLDWPRTGVGVLQRQLYPRLESLGWRVTLGPRRPPNGARVASRLGYKLRQLAAIVTSDAALVCTTPAPLRGRAPTVLVVHDLRWLRTRARPAMTYRRFDLRRSVVRAAAVLTDSERSRDDLLARFPQARAKTETAHLGPGQLASVIRREPDLPGRLLLLGGAPHKRNDLAAAALARATPQWVNGITGVGLSRLTEEFLVASFGPDRCRFHHGLDSSALVQVLHECAVYMNLSVEEGFGLPYVEALCAGCHVIAIDQSLTRELLRDAAVLLLDGDDEQLAAQLADPRWVDADRRAQQASRYSWDAYAATVDEALRRSVREP